MKEDAQWSESDFRVRGWMLSLFNKFPTTSIFVVGFLGCLFYSTLGTLVVSIIVGIGWLLSLLFPVWVVGIFGTLFFSLMIGFVLWVCLDFDDFKKELTNGIRKFLMSGKIPAD